MVKWQANGQHAAFARARRYLRLVRTLVRAEVPYIAPAGRGAGISGEARAAAIATPFLPVSDPFNGALKRPTQKANS